MKKIVSSLSIGSTMLLSGMLNASTFLIDGTSITSDGVGFSQNTANTYYLPSTNGELTNITFSDGRGINITSLNELNVPSSPDINIVGILSGGSTVNAIIGLGMVSNVVITDAISGQDFRQNWLKGGVGLEAKIGQGKGSLMLNGTTRGEAASAWLAASYQMAF